MDTAPLFQSARKFKVWHYTISHSCLLLRSNKDNLWPNRIEVLFVGVELMSVRPYMDGLVISPIAPMIVPSRGLDPVNVYQLVSEGFTGQVASVAMFFGEDNLEYFDPTYFQNAYVPGQAP